ncbi:hypothetical protein ABZY02_35180 [Streptomyces sp. NPDC006649]|uniref:hypothetical protein n=1 Tax=Streptomyces sp. NPDC006649 TaxID=3156896 RepID=UPI0033BE38E3
MSIVKSPWPADLIPEVTGLARFNAAYNTALRDRAVFIGVGRRSRRWFVKADTLTAAPAHVTGENAQRAIVAAFVRLVGSREISRHSGPGPVHYTMNGLAGEARARELAAALHAALFGDLEPLALSTE